MGSSKCFNACQSGHSVFWNMMHIFVIFWKKENFWAGLFAKYGTQPWGVTWIGPAVGPVSHGPYSSKAPWHWASYLILLPSCGPWGWVSFSLTRLFWLPSVYGVWILCAISNCNFLQICNRPRQGKVDNWLLLGKMVKVSGKGSRESKR